MVYKSKRKKSRFQSKEKGTLIVNIMEEDEENIKNRQVKFKEIKVLFY